MANPLIVALTKDVWTKVATNVTSGAIHAIDKAPNLYLQTYRLTGVTAPVNNDDAVPMLIPTDIIEASVGIDVYIQPVNVDGAIRIDV